MARRICSAALLGVMWFHPGAAQDAPPPEAASGRVDRAAVTAERFMIVTANPLASDAGAAVLARGGSAVDAMVAAQFVLNLVEPQSSGIGGGAFLLYWDAKAQQAHHLRRRARPRRRRPGRICSCKPDGTPMPFDDSRDRRPLGRRARHAGPARAGASAARPAALGRSGRSRRPTSPTRGFEISPRLAAAIADGAAKLTPVPGDARLLSGHRRRAAAGGRACCAILSSRRPCAQIAAEGSAPFYRGRIGDAHRRRRARARRSTRAC